jgi:hypothetical protein
MSTIGSQLIVYQTFELSLKIKIVNADNIKELNFNLIFLTICHYLVCHNFYNVICKKPNLPDVYLWFLTLYNYCHVCSSFLCPPIVLIYALRIIY